MLKFRMTNSMKARRAAEAQRRALEEKLKMEWAWKPMAAVMNEKESDLVYWVPPLYTSNLLTSFSSSSSRCSSLSSSPASSIRRSSIKRSSIKIPPSSLADTSPRKKKLAQRRAKLSPEDSFQEDDEMRSSGKAGEKKRDEPTTDDDKESGIHDEFHDSALEDDSQWEDSLHRKRKISRQSTRSREFNQRSFSKKREKFRHIPTLLKVVNKLATIYTLPTRPTPIVAARRLERKKRLERNKELRNSSIRKPKRPSVKIYSVQPQRASMKKLKLTEENAKPEPYYVITRTKTPFGSRQQSFSEKKAPNTRTHIGLPTLSENELRNAHLEMILKILANLYEEKLTTQSSEISLLKSKVQAQEKLLKQTAHAVIGLRNYMKTLQAKFDFNQEVQKFYKKKVTEPEQESSIPYHPLEPLPEESCDTPQNNHPPVNIHTEDYGPINYEKSDVTYIEVSQTSSPSSFDDSSEVNPSLSSVIESADYQSSVVGNSYATIDRAFPLDILQHPSVSFSFDSQSSVGMTTAISIPIDAQQSYSTLNSEIDALYLQPDEIQRRASTPTPAPRSILKTSKTQSLDFTPGSPNPSSELASANYDIFYYPSTDVSPTPLTLADRRRLKLRRGTESSDSLLTDETSSYATSDEYCQGQFLTAAEIHAPPPTPATADNSASPSPTFHRTVLNIEIGQDS